MELHFGRGDPGTSQPNRAVRRDGLDGYIWVEDLDALSAELQSRAATVVEGPILRGYGVREIVVEDCNGFRLAFGEPVAP